MAHETINPTCQSKKSTARKNSLTALKNSIAALTPKRHDVKKKCFRGYGRHCVLYVLTKFDVHDVSGFQGNFSVSSVPRFNRPASPLPLNNEVNGHFAVKFVKLLKVG